MWYLDTRASNHMTNDKSKFCELNQTIQDFVRFGNGSKVKIEGKGSIIFIAKMVSSESCKKFTTYQICVVISLGQFSEGGDEIRIKDPFLWVNDVIGKFLMKAQRSQNRHDKITLNEVRSECLLVEISDPTWL